jgi:PAS domain S-box-containing protein
MPCCGCMTTAVRKKRNFTSDADTRDFFISSFHVLLGRLEYAHSLSFIQDAMTYQVLLVEERIADAELIQAALQQSTVSCRITHVRRLADALALSVNNRFDAVLLNLFLSDSHGLDTYVAMRSHAPTLPLILLTDSVRQDITSEAAKKGAQDYLAMDEISPSVLGKALLYAIERKRHERELREQKEFYENLLREANVWVEALDRRGNVILWNKGAEKITGYDAETVLSQQRRWELLFPDETVRTQKLEEFDVLLQSERGLREFEGEILTTDGLRRVIQWNSNIIRGKAGEVVGCMLVGNDVTERRNSSRDVIESERRFRTLAEVTSDYVYAAAVHEDGSVVTQWVEGAFERITGFHPDEILEKPGAWYSIIHEADVPTREAFLRAIEGTSLVFEYRIRRKDGSERWLRDRVRCLRDEQGSRITGLLGAVSDITKEKEARLSEIQARRILDTLLDSAHDYAFLLAPDGTILSAGRMISSFFGRSPDEMTGKALFDFIPPEYPADRLQRLRDLCAAREVYEYTTEFLGHTIIVRATPVFDESGDPFLLAVFGRDVTEERRAQDVLSREQEKFRGIIENSTDGISLVDGSGHVIEWSPAMTQITGIARDAALGRTHAEMLHLLTPEENRSPQVLEKYTRLFDDYRKTGEAPWLGRLSQRWIQRPDGSRRHIEMISFSIRSSFDMLTGSVVRDVTEIKLAEENLEEKNIQLAEQNMELMARNEELDTFTHSVAHDLKNPLSLILGYADMVQNEGADFDATELQAFMGSIMFNGRKMISIINSLLLLASVRKEEVEGVRLDMKLIVGDALRRTEKQLAESGISVSLPAEWFSPLGYAPWVEEVWVNYFSNAAKHAGKGSRVSVTAERLGDGMLRYAVTDDGQGIPADLLGELFVPFTRLSQAKIEGHGLGLSIVKRIVEKLGGSVHVRSVEGEGSSFSFTLPDAEAGR